MRNLMMANSGRNMQFLSSSNKHLLDIQCCVIDCNYPTLNYYTQWRWQISEFHSDSYKTVNSQFQRPLHEK